MNLLQKTGLSLGLILVSNLGGAQESAAWKCTADGLVTFRYTGGDWAYIHLQAFSTGGNYKVTLNELGNEAKGMTANRTPFVCTKQLEPPK